MTSEDDKFSPRCTASQAAYEKTQILSQQSKLSVLKECIQPVRWESVQQKSLLGKGAFSEVYRVDINTPELKDKKCALKYLSPKITNIKEGSFDLAAIDLATEANILSRLNHENIIHLHGVFGGELRTSYVDYEKGYFLLLDLLNDTLPKRLDQARAKERRRILSGSISFPKMLERIEDVALGVSKGLEYLHQNGVVFRDLKPDNIGFTKDGKPVIFDFGFAREVHTVKAGDIAGSLRYMSPEMAFGQDPKLPSDVYSFGVLLFEVCTLEKPFKQFNQQAEFKEKVLIEDYRPPLTSIPSTELRDLITRTWNPDPKNRPDMTSVVKLLRVEVALSERQVQKGKLGLHRPKSCASNISGTLKRGSTMAALTSNAMFRRGSFHAENKTIVSTPVSEMSDPISDLSLVDMGRSSTRKVSISSCSSASDISPCNSSHSLQKSEFTLGRLRKPFRRRPCAKS